MKKEIKESLIQNLKSALDTQSRICLELDVNGEIGETIYTKEDLLNASLVFSHILGNISAGYCFNELKLDTEQSKLIAEESGKNIRQTILIATGLDMHLIVQNNGK